MKKISVLLGVGAIFLLGTATTAQSQTTDTQAVPAGTPVSAAEIQKAIVGRYVTIGSNLALYRSDGTYTYDGVMAGKYRISDGSVCVDFEKGEPRCDKIIDVNGKRFVVDPSGKQFAFSPL
jgi:urease beta subunit